MTILEECEIDQSMYIGNTDFETAYMTINRSELASFMAQDIIFQSRIGHMHSYGFDQATDMAGVFGQVVLTY